MIALASFAAAHPTAIHIIGIAMGLVGIGLLAGPTLCRTVAGAWDAIHDDSLEIQR